MMSVHDVNLIPPAGTEIASRESQCLRIRNLSCSAATSDFVLVPASDIGCNNSKKFLLALFVIVMSPCL